MNVLIVAELVAKSGVGKYILELSDRLIKTGNKVVIATPNKSVEDYNSEIRWYSLKTPRFKNWLSIVKSVNAICEAENIDVIHANHRNIAAPLRFCNRKRHIPVLLTYHTSVYPNSKLKDMMAYNGDACIAVSTEVKQLLLSKKVPEEKIRLILNGVDEEKLLPPTKKEKEMQKQRLGVGGKTCIVMHGRIDRVKGIDLLVDAAMKMNEEELRDLAFVVSGEKSGAYYESLTETIEKANLQSYFHFTGWINSADIFRTADLCVAPSRREGFPLSVIEAMLMGVPVCRTRTGGFQDMEAYVLPIETESSDAIVCAVREFMRDKQKYEAIALQATSFAKNHCTIATMTDATVRLYRELVGERRESECRSNE